MSVGKPCIQNKSVCKVLPMEMINLDKQNNYRKIYSSKPGQAQLFLIFLKLSAVYWCHDFGSILSSVAESGSTCQYIFQIVHSVFFCFTSGIDPRVFSLGTSSVICRQSSLIWLLQLCATYLLKFLYSFAGEAPERGICDYILTGISFLIFLCTLPVSLCFTLKVRP